MHGARFIALTPVPWGKGQSKAISLLQLATADGLVGTGSAYVEVADLQRTVDLLWDLLRVDELDPVDHYHAARRLLGPEAAPPQIAALAGVDMALWDLRGKREGRPVCELLGGAQIGRAHV